MGKHALAGKEKEVLDATEGSSALGTLARKLSPNYRRSPERFKEWHPVAAAGYVLFDYCRHLMDRAANVIERAMLGKNDLPRETLEEFEIRLIDRSLLAEDSVVYAFGVARHIETEELLAERVGCTVHLFDPTPPALEFMASRPKDPKLVFDPIGVWTSSGPVRFYFDRRETPKNLSVVNMYHTDDFMEAPCYTLTDIMRRHGHERIDVLKMDIEGSALPVLAHMLRETTLRPPQIVGALERPLFVFGTPFWEVAKVILGKAKLFRDLRKEGYRIRAHHAAEFTAVRKTS